MPAECSETKQNANQSVCTLCVREQQKAKTVSLSSPPSESLPLRESDACELKQEIAGNVPGMHALYMQPRKKKKKKSSLGRTVSH
jgi:hypothetical protein